MFEKFHPDARQAIVASYAQTASTGQDRIGCGQLVPVDAAGCRGRRRSG